MNTDCKTCVDCDSLVKDYIDESKIAFKAKCNRCTVAYSNGTNSLRVIMEKCGPMLTLETPEWCPKKRNVIQEYVHETNLDQEKPTLVLPPPTKQPVKVLTYTERMDAIKTLPREIEWDDIQVGDIYVLPKSTSYSKGRRIKIATKCDRSFSYYELDLESGEPSWTTRHCFKSDVESTLLKHPKNF